MSLKDILQKTLREKGDLSYGDVCQLSAEEGYKSETATRRLREMTDVEPIMAKSKRGTNYVAGYSLKKEEFVALRVDQAKKYLNETFQSSLYTIPESQKVWRDVK